MGRGCDVIVYTVNGVQDEGVEVEGRREGVRVGTLWSIVGSN